MKIVESIKDYFKEKEDKTMENLRSDLNLLKERQDAYAGLHEQVSKSYSELKERLELLENNLLDVSQHSQYHRDIAKTRLDTQSSLLTDFENRLNTLEDRLRLSESNIEHVYDTIERYDNKKSK